MGRDGQAAHGPELVRQMRAFLDANGVEILLRNRVITLDRSVDGRITGAVIEDADGTLTRVNAAKGVIFGSGGFTHNASMRRHYLRGPVVGGCGIATNTGDFVGLAAECGAAMGVMNSGAWSQMIYDDASDTSNGNIDLFELPGDSVIAVNKYGKRVVNESLNYHERSQIHHTWDRGEYPNYLLFMVYDQRAAQEFSGSNPIPPFGAVAPHVVEGATIDELLSNLDGRLVEFEDHPPHGISTGRTRIHESAADNLRAAISRFNGFARSGVDEDFHRGELPVESSQHEPRRPSNDMPNPHMFPIAESGPYYAVILIGATYETRSGPLINSDGQVLDHAGEPIPGLYGAGDCVASVFGQSYPGGGANIGPALVFGYRAGVHAVRHG
jgi:3-oxosteroid 1-dehydrogenase